MREEQPSLISGVTQNIRGATAFIFLVFSSHYLGLAAKRAFLAAGAGDREAPLR
jgi:hypothetical protein